jgi:hypothetical protein
MAKVNDQMSDLGKSINVFNNNRDVKNPFLHNAPPAPEPSQEPGASNGAPEPPSNASCADE